MLRRAYLFALVPLLLHVGLTSAQEHYPVMEKIAQKVIQKYQTSSCQQLAMKKSQPPKGQQAQMDSTHKQLSSHSLELLWEST